MADIKEALIEWAIHYFKNRDILTRKITSIEKDKGGADILIQTTDQTNAVIVNPHLKSETTSTLAALQSEKITLISLNTKENFDFIKANWTELTKIGHHFSIISVNPITNQKWIVFPHTHHSMSEGNFELGLETLQKTVQEITKDEAEKYASEC